MPQPALLALEDGSVFQGISIGRAGQSVGEVVFNTAMTGYQEILSDPSYARQIITLTYPHIGNTGTNAEDMESGKVHAAGLVIRDLPRVTSNFRCQQSLQEFLVKHGVVAIAEIDTRRLTRVLREKGSQRGCLLAAAKGERLNKKEAIAAARGFAGLEGMDLAKSVTTKKTYEWNLGEWALGRGYIEAGEAHFHIAAYDFGVKHNILRMLAQRGCRVTVVPAKTPAEDILNMKVDGVFLSNGPGDPEPCDYAIEAIRILVDKGLPTFGICLGHQLLALASGASTSKMKFGHHGANHPVKDLRTGQVMITSQNHGFAVAEEALSSSLEVTHRSLFDQSIQGIRRTDRPAFSFQGHPEASPGPHDVASLFDHFVDLMADNA
ncbi:MAG: glutamine-hydrolyzing carbamoyl-phosphate synthase small subunit [Gammaproteobacteria bacterium]|nr:MAG: glutamine-hydrolyzing carbamoyl-phosphate synthase small subunit [Gammaproteobacteria bacterium]